MPLTYSDSGVDRKLREKAKKHLVELKETYSFSKYGPVVETPFNVLYPIGDGRYQVKTSDGVGTKVLLAQLAEKHDTIGVDAVAMVANDCIRSGAEPLAITDVIDLKKSEPGLFGELLKGLNSGASEAGCPLIGGETADVPELMQAEYHINCDCVGEVKEEKIVDGSKIKPGNVVIGLKSSGVHSNGISLVRKVLFKEWGGRYDPFEKPEPLDKELIYEVLKPTKIYVRPVMKVMKEIEVLGAVHITGDAYLKFHKLGVGFEFDNFHPQPIFELIQQIGGIADDEMFKTFNLGWGFALVVNREDAVRCVDMIGDEFGPEIIGKVIPQKKIVVKYKTKELVL
ncbi:MAG: phosphoribosylformylglycinamidine cyclo-ligase [Candidatus Diapherotrites archaeon]|nr:phosphoribosylformylglycinamidine cyclo-ligase [Candidatus Diapherotrites archaeon]